MSKLVRWPNDYTEIEHRAQSFDGPYSLTATVVITYYQDIDLLGGLLSSLARQTYPPSLYDVVIVDDGSPTPLALATVAEYLHTPVRIIRLTHQAYQISTMRNIGMRQSTADVILCVDQDILCPPCWLEAHLKWHHAANQIATFGLRRFVNRVASMDATPDFIAAALEGPDIPSASTGFHPGDKRAVEVESLKSNPYPFNCFHGCNVSFRRQEALAVGGFSEKFNGGFGYEDIEFGARLFARGNQIAYVPDSLVVHQENYSFTTGQRTSGAARNLLLLYESIPELRDYRKLVRDK